MTFVTGGDTKLIAAIRSMVITSELQLSSLYTARLRRPICPWRASSSCRSIEHEAYGICEHKVGGDDSRLASSYVCENRARLCTLWLGAISNPVTKARS